MPSSFTIKRNDTTPISGTLKNPSNNAEDIENATLRFHMFKEDKATEVVDAAASNDQVGDGSDGSKGDWSYSFTAGDTDESGKFYGEVEVTFSDGVITTYPNDTYFQIRIIDDLA